MSDKNTVTVKVNARHIIIYIRSIPHLILKRTELIGIQSWLKTLGIQERAYFIEYTTQSRVILCDYDDIKLWTDILLELEKANVFNYVMGEAAEGSLSG